MWGCRAHHSPMPQRPRHDWSRRLPQPLAIPTVMQLETLADVRALVEKHLPNDRRERLTWRHVAAEP